MQSLGQIAQPLSVAKVQDNIRPNKQDLSATELNRLCWRCVVNSVAKYDLN